MFCWVGLFGHSFFNTVFVYNQSKCWYSIIHCVKYVKSQGFSFSSNNDLFFVQHVGAQENYYLFFLLNLNVSDDGDCIISLTFTSKLKDLEVEGKAFKSKITYTQGRFN